MRAGGTGDMNGYRGGFGRGDAGKRRRRVTLLRPVAAALITWLVADTAHAGVSQQAFISHNNKLYFLISSNASAGSYGSQITSLIMASGTAVPIAETSDNPP